MTKTSKGKPMTMKIAIDDPEFPKTSMLITLALTMVATFMVYVAVGVTTLAMYGELFGWPSC